MVLFNVFYVCHAYDIRTSEFVVYCSIAGFASNDRLFMSIYLFWTVHFIKGCLGGYFSSCTVVTSYGRVDPRAGYGKDCRLVIIMRSRVNVDALCTCCFKDFLFGWSVKSYLISCPVVVVRVLFMIDICNVT